MSAIPGALLAASTSTALGIDTGPSFEPDVHVTQLHVDRIEQGMRETIHWRALPARLRTIQVVELGRVDARDVTDHVGTTVKQVTGTRRTGGATLLRQHVATVAPDGYDELDGRVMGYIWPIVGRQRSGESVIRSGKLAGRSVLVGRTTLAANECAGMSSGMRTVYMDRRTLVPLRVVDKRAGEPVTVLRFPHRRARAADFAPLRSIGRTTRIEEGYVARSPAASAARADFPVQMPTSMPDGFRMQLSGTGTQGAYLGPEASFPRSAGVFFARWTRGLERLDLTIRPARATLASDWDRSDPFGGECERTASSTVQVGDITAHYAIGEFGSPRMWWRDGSTLYTLSGPFSVEQLATVASSLATVGS